MNQKYLTAKVESQCFLETCWCIFGFQEQNNSYFAQIFGLPIILKFSG